MTEPPKTWLDLKPPLYYDQHPHYSVSIGTQWILSKDVHWSRLRFFGVVYGPVNVVLFGNRGNSNARSETYYGISTFGGGQPNVRIELG